MRRTLADHLFLFALSHPLAIALEVELGREERSNSETDDRGQYSGLRHGSGGLRATALDRLRRH